MPTGIQFPAELPVPLRDSYSETFEEIHRALQMEVGASRRRARMRTAPRRFSINLVLSQTEFAVFDSWWQNTILGGERSFDIRLLDGDDVDPLLWYTVTAFEGEYQLNVSQSLDYEVSFVVRAVEDGFSDRPSGTDTLKSSISMGLQSVKGRLQVTTPLRGRTNIGFSSVRAISNLPPLRGVTLIGIRPRARIPMGPITGYALISISASARLPLAPFTGTALISLMGKGELGT